MRPYIDMYNFDLLYVEDSPSDQRLLQEALKNSKEFQFNIRLASSLKEAEKMFLISEPDVILSDLNLADHRGKDTIDKVTKLFQNKPVILLTESKNMEITRYASSLGIQDFLVKGEDLQTEKLVRSIQMAKIRYDKEYQKLLKINDELRQSVEELKKSQFLISNQVSLFSHKVRGPICTMEGLLNMLENMPEALTHKEVVEHLRGTFKMLKGQVDTTVGKLSEKTSHINSQDI